MQSNGLLLNRCRKVWFASSLVMTLLSGPITQAKAFDWRSMDDTLLLTHACNYATSDTKKAQARLALNELKRRGPDGLRALMKHMHIRNIYIRVTADNWVRGSKDEALISPLLESLDSEHERTRSQAAYLLGYYELPQYAEKILPLLEDEKTDQSAIRTLGKWKVSEALERIYPYLQHDEERYRIYAANALRDIADPNTTHHLIPLLNDKFFTVRYVAARALETIGQLQPLKTAHENAKGIPKRHLARIIEALETPEP